jgi:hypothetical protein
MLIATLFILLISTSALVTAQSYQPITTITGSSDQTTDYFYVPTGEWRISWSYVPNPSYPSLVAFSVFAYPKGESTVFIASIVETDVTTTSGVTYVHEGQGGDYYLKISAANIQNYTITIEGATASPSPSVPEFPTVLTVMALIITVGTATVLLAKKQTRSIHK